MAKQALLYCLFMLASGFVAYAQKDTEKDDKLPHERSFNTSFIIATNTPSTLFTGLNGTYELVKPDDYAAGVGSGIEYQMRDTFNVLAVPMFIKLQKELVKGNEESIYAFTNLGISFGLSTSSLFSVDSINHPRTTGKLATGLDDFLMSDFYVTIGAGYETEGGWHLDAFLRTQPSNLLAPFFGRLTYLGFSTGYRFR